MMKLSHVLLLLASGAMCSCVGRAAGGDADDSSTGDQDASGNGDHGGPGDNDTPTDTEPPPPVCIPTDSSETSCNGLVDEDCDGDIDCADSECGGLACGADGFTCISGGCAKAGVLPELPPLENVQAQVFGRAAEIGFQPVDGARDYRVYVFPDLEDVTAFEDGRIVVQDALYRCAGSRMAPGNYIDNEVSGGNGYPYRTRVDNVEIGGHTRTLAQATLGYVWISPGAGRLPVYSLSSPNRSSEDACFRSNTFESRLKEYTSSESRRATLIAEGWRDNGPVFYVPETASGATHTIYTHTYDGNNRLYYQEGPEADRHSGKQAVFQALTAAGEGTKPLKRVFYEVSCGSAHDELMAGEARFLRAYYQGSDQPVFGLHWSGLSGQTTLVVEALDELCPFPGWFIGPVTVSGGGRSSIWKTLADTQALSATGEVYINGQGDGTSPRPIARSFVTVSPQAAPTLDWSYGFTANDGIGASYTENECLAGKPEDCGGGDWRTWGASNVVTANVGIVSDYYGIAEVLGELWTGLTENSASGKFRLYSPVKGQMSAGSYLYATMLVDSVTTGRRYPQILISESRVSYPVAQNLDGTKSLVIQSFGDWGTDFALQVCNERLWEVNNQCPSYPDGRWVLDEANPDKTDPVSLRPVPDFFEMAVGLDQPIRYEVYASTERVYLLANGQPYSCHDLPDTGAPTGEVTVAFGSVLYHASAETVPSDFLNRTDPNISIRHFGNLGIRSGSGAPIWDEARIPCQPASWLGPGR